MFQSTRPRGARQYLSDPAKQDDIVSIHAPARGATLLKTLMDTMGCSFQSTRPRGARQGGDFMSDQELMFQSTRPRGARPRTLRARAELW